MRKKEHFKFLLFLFAITILFSTCQSGCNTEPPVETGGEEFEIDGYTYIHHIKNNGPLAQPTEYVEYHYTMSADDSLLTNSRDLNLVSQMQIPPVTPDRKKPSRPQPILTGLKMMSVGDSMTIKLPMDSLPQKPMGFGKYQYLVYDIAVVGVKNQEEFVADNQAKAKKIQAQREADMAREDDIKNALLQTIQDYKSGKLAGQLQETGSGLKYLVHEKGKGKMPKDLNPIKVHYYAMLEDGTPFDNSFKGGNPYFFTLGAGQVYRGWDEGIALFPIGSKVTLILPPSLLVFGENNTNPNIPADKDMFFYLETLYPY